MKTFKTILIISILVIGTGFLVALPANAGIDELIVEYSSDGGNTWLSLSVGSMFGEINFLPGNSVTRLIRVTNNSTQTQRIAVEAINQTNIGDLASQLDIIIKEGSNTIYNKTLKQFFDDKEIYLSSLNTGSQTQYDFDVNFKSSAGDDYQGKSAGFNLIVGFEGTEGGLTLPQPGGSASSGGGLPSGLTITNETLLDIQQISVTITWLTNYFSTSQVIYGTENENHTLNLNDNAGSPPKYGYAHTTLEYDVSPKVTFHSVTITDLTPNTKYYYRAVSHASLAVSREYSFYTLAVANTEENKEEFNETAQEQEETSFKENIIAVEPLSDKSGGSSFVGGEEEDLIGENQSSVPKSEEEQKNRLMLLLAAGLNGFLGIFKSNLWIILLLIILAVIIILKLYSKSKRKRKKEV